jgi:hypothetical protein
MDAIESLDAERMVIAVKSNQPRRRDVDLRLARKRMRDVFPGTNVASRHLSPETSRSRVIHPYL